MLSIPAIQPINFRSKGLFIGLAIISLWVASLCFLLNYTVSFSDPLLYIFVLVQTHLYTGIFITAHDSIHGLVVPHNKKLNYWVGFVCTIIFAFNNFKILSHKHHQHHQHAATAADPDYHDGNPHFLAWYFAFLKEYVSWQQILGMAITYNILKLIVPMENLIVFWMFPAILSTLQLFYFGTYTPHKGEHTNRPFNARSQPLDHFKAFVSCYFFGYHFEHHAYPFLPWWALPKAREIVARQVVTS